MVRGIEGGRDQKCDGFASRNDGKQNVSVFMENYGVFYLPGGVIVLYIQKRIIIR